MRIYLVRHGKAADEGYRFDEDRPLTDVGRALLRRTAEAWVKEASDKEPELWLTSPLVRAVQTCEIALHAFDQDGPVEVTRALVPEGPPSAAAALLDRPGMPGAIALVGHEPLMSDLASLLLGRQWPEGFKKGAVLAMKRAAGETEAKFLWYLEPAKEEREARLRATF
jgi:phosphohistidine phosphatase